MKAKLVIVIFLVLFFGCANPSGGGGGGGGDDTNNAPTATNVSISGGLFMQGDDLLTGNYDYSDTEGDAEGTSTFAWIWYASDDSTCSGTGTAITDATNDTYQLTHADNDHYIRFEITPVAAIGTANGTAAKSACTIQVES